MGPTPLGYTEAEWVSFLRSSIETSDPTIFGGLTIHTVEIDEPLIFEGEIPEIELVPLSENQMMELGVAPGDFSEDSTSANMKIYYHQEMISDTGEGYTPVDDDSLESSEESGPDDEEFFTDDYYYCPPPYYCQLWNNVNGSGLFYNKLSKIETKSYSLDGATTSPRLGEACFSADTACLTLGFSGNTTSSIITTGYGYETWVWYNGYLQFIWFVADPVTWVEEGEDAWDSIVVHGDGNLATNRIRVTNINVQHNGYTVGIETDDFTMDPANPSFNLTPALQEYKYTKRFHVSQSTVVSAVGDWVQGAHLKYPVTALPNPSYGNALAPIPWCTEFASWAFRENYDHILGSCTGCEHLPELGEWKHPSDPTYGSSDHYSSNDISVRNFFNWSVAVGRRLYYGNDANSNLNGPTVSQWQNLATAVGAGDYVAYYFCTDSSCTAWGQHSEIVIGWSNAAKTAVHSSYFQYLRECNLLQTVSGNLGGSPGRVTIQDDTVCRRPVWNSLFQRWDDPSCDIDGDGVQDVCDIRLWDTNLYNGEYEGGFFAQMP